MSTRSSRCSTPSRSRGSGSAKGASSRVKVFVRLRDCVDSEDVSDNCVSMSDTSCEVRVPGRGRFAFAFDGCLWSHRVHSSAVSSICTQRRLYEVVGRPVLDAALEGFNACILSYGATGSGKTYSTFGPPNAFGTEEQGLIPRICDGIFTYLASIPRHAEPRVTISMMEVYLEQVYDLLHHRKQLSVRGEGANFVAVGARQPQVASYLEVLDLLNDAEKCKTFSATAIHERSSRAHTLFQVELSFARDDGTRVKSKIALADLAGCERVRDAKTEAGVAFGEACNINLSLLTLGSCIEAVVSRASLRSSSGGSATAVGIGEFRNSTLTRLLKEFIGGNSLTTMLITVAPTLESSNNTIQALRFADRAKRLQTTVTANREEPAHRSGRNASRMDARDSSSTQGGLSLAAVSHQRHEETARRRDLLLQELEREAEVARAQDVVSRLEEAYSRCSDTELDSMFRALEAAMLDRDASEQKLDAVRREAYPREYALRDEVEQLSAALESLQDRYDLERAVAGAAAQSGSDPVLSAAEREELEDEVARLRRRCQAHEDELHRISDKWEGRLEQLEQEKAQLELHYRLQIEERARDAQELACEVDALRRENQSLERRCKVSVEDCRRQCAKTVAMRSAVECERAQWAEQAASLAQFLAAHSEELLTVTSGKVVAAIAAAEDVLSTHAVHWDDSAARLRREYQQQLREVEERSARGHHAQMELVLQSIATAQRTLQLAVETAAASPSGCGDGAMVGVAVEQGHHHSTLLSPPRAALSRLVHNSPWTGSSPPSGATKRDAALERLVIAATSSSPSAAGAIPDPLS